MQPLTRWMIALGVFASLLAPARPADLSGEQLYKAQCVRCHGAQGEGGKHYKKPLEGNLSVAQLADLVQKTMPESAPGSLSLDEARAISKHIHGLFYSQVAREKNRPARVELSRLTVRQYRQSLTDLIGSFRWQRGTDAQQGLKAEYYRGRNTSKENRMLERVDPRVAFDFGTASPVPGKIEPNEFSIHWRGSIIAPETGEYEFIVRTEHATRLWINDDWRHPLVDAWVKSGNDTEFKSSLFLIGGRAYHLSLDFAKAKQGVDDSKEKKAKQPPTKASITLSWKPPHRVVEPIPERYLSPLPAPDMYVCSTPFPPDDRSTGWERGTAISKEWDQATTEGALETANYVAAHLDDLVGAPAGKPERAAKVQTFCRNFAQRAFRAPLTQELQAAVDHQYEAGKDEENGIKRVVLWTLLSPRFLYREVADVPAGFDTAARLAFALWDSLPDQTLLDAAAAGQLVNQGQVAWHAERMLADPRGKAKLHDFFLTWLRVDVGNDLARDAKLFPGFDANLLADLRSSLELTIDDILWSPNSDLRQLFLADEIYLNARLASFYGLQLPAGATYQKVKLDAGKRAGVLTHPYLMTALAHVTTSSPIHRGVFLARGVLGMSLRPPPEAVAPLPPELHSSLTTRQRIALQTKPVACTTCHGVINPLGFTLEHFDAVGRYREKEGANSVDATGSYTTTNGQTVNINGARELAKFVAESDEAHTAFVEQLFHHLVQQPVRAYGSNAIDDLRRSFAANGFNIRKLAIAEATLAAQRPRRVVKVLGE